MASRRWAPTGEFAAVFKGPRVGGPGRHLGSLGSEYPNWPDRRYPGNTNANEQAQDIMKKWDPYRMKRFEIFLETFYQKSEREPRYKEWLDKTTNNWKDDEVKIIKCKLELVKRLLIIRMCGPERMEDWILLFLYVENDLQIPQNIEELIAPQSASLILRDYLAVPDQYPENYNPRTPYGFVGPPVSWLWTPGNMSMPGIDQRREQRDEIYYRPWYWRRPADIFREPFTTQRRTFRRWTETTTFPRSTSGRGLDHVAGTRSARGTSFASLDQIRAPQGPPPAPGQDDTRWPVVFDNPADRMDY